LVRPITAEKRVLVFVVPVSPPQLFGNSLAIVLVDSALAIRLAVPVDVKVIARPSSSSSSSSEAFSIPEVDVGLPMLVPPGGGGHGALLWNRKSTKASKSSPHVFGRLDIIIYAPLRLESIRDVQV
jgi:hypothetical protein